MPGLYVRDTGGVNRKYRELHEAQGGVDRKLREMYARDTQGVSRRVFSGAPGIASINYDYTKLSHGSITKRDSDFAVYYGAEQIDGRSASISLKFSEPFTVTELYLNCDAYISVGGWSASDDVVDYFDGEDVAFFCGLYVPTIAQYPESSIKNINVNLTRPNTSARWITGQDTSRISGRVYDTNEDITFTITNGAGFHGNVTAYLYAVLTTEEFGEIRIPADL